MQNFLLLLIVIGLPIAIVVPLVIGHGRNRACPKCKKWWAKTFLRNELVEKTRAMGLVNRKAKTTSTGLGHAVYSSGSTSWQERVPVIRETWRTHFGCRFCKAQWFFDEGQEREDFGD